MTVLAIALFLMALIAYFFIAAIWASGAGQTMKNAERTRSRFILVLLAVGAVVTIVSLKSWPHSVAVTGPSTTVNVTGLQWAWDIDTEEVPIGHPIIFNTHAADVTHGFGVTDPDGRLLVQTQVMPGYVNQVKYTFDRPGTYKVICLEYCGAAHHDMISEFKVVAQSGAEQ